MRLSGRQVHQLAGTGSEAGVRRVLTRLARTGLVLVHYAGNSLLYTPLNTSHLAAKAVSQLANLRTIFIGTVQLDIGSWSVPPIHASLFGSAARVTATSTATWMYFSFERTTSTRTEHVNQPAIRVLGGEQLPVALGDDFDGAVVTLMAV